jgi:hypothetical protein
MWRCIMEPSWKPANPLRSLVRSRKFWLAVFGVGQTVTLHLVNVDPAVWQAIDGLVLALIAAIAGEDMAEKRAG